MNMANIRFKIRINLSWLCNICSQQHRLLRVPISAMFKTNQAYIQEAGFGQILWQLLWKIFPKEMCINYPKECVITESPILKRELKVSSFIRTQRNNRDYDYAINLEPIIGESGWLLFSLTTAMWKKSGFHDTKKPKEYIQNCKEMLLELPSTLENTKSIWYVVVPTTEENFFDYTAPDEVSDLNMLLQKITNNNQRIFHPVVIFNSTSRKGEARHELRKLMTKKIQQTKIYPIIEELLSEVKYN